MNILKIVKLDLICMMVAMVNNKSYLTGHGFPKKNYLMKSISLAIICLHIMATRKAHLYNHVIWMA